jgi:hypothetical protein
MNRRRIFPLALLLATVLLCSPGCAIVRGWWMKSSTPAAKKADETTADEKKTATPAELAAIMAEVQQLGALDPAAQNALLEDLKRTDPALWPQLVQTFRASIAYRRQMEERTRLARGQNPQSGLAGAQGLPATTDGAVAPKAPSPEFAKDYPDTKMPAVKLASATSADTGDWRTQLASLARNLESQQGAIGATPGTAPSASSQAAVRMMYLAAGQRDDALRPMSGVSANEQEFWTSEFYGLSTELDTDRMPDPSRRAAEAAEHLRNAATTLGHSGSLIVRNLTFCTEVNSYGMIKPFAKYDFKPGEQVILYAEVENFASETTEKGFHTALKSSYEILDSRGVRVDGQDFAVTEEVCRNARRDFFIRYFVFMPKRIYDGTYSLQLTLEDTLGKKVVQSVIKFNIVGAD